jgi:hypothetical protein
MNSNLLEYANRLHNLSYKPSIPHTNAVEHSTPVASSPLNTSSQQNSDESALDLTALESVRLTETPEYAKNKPNRSTLGFKLDLS